VDSPFQFSEAVQPGAFLSDNKAFGKSGLTYSWGYRVAEEQVAAILTKKSMNFISATECKKQVPEFEESEQICALDSVLCENDIGSPLFVVVNGKSLQVGFASHPKRCDYHSKLRNAIYVKLTADVWDWASRVTESL
jgi:Trypsin